MPVSMLLEMYGLSVEYVLIKLCFCVVPDASEKKYNFT